MRATRTSSVHYDSVTAPAAPASLPDTPPRASLSFIHPKSVEMVTVVPGPRQVARRDSPIIGLEYRAPEAIKFRSIIRFG